MILSNVAIYEALDLGRVVLTPEPTPRRVEVGQDSPYDTHSVDVRLAKHLSIPNTGPFLFDLEQPPPKPGQPAAKGGFAAFLSKNTTKIDIPDSGYTLAPNTFALGQTLEHIHLPINTPANRVLKRCLAARIEGKSSRARTGLLVHFTAPTIHPGFRGPVTLELINLGPVGFVLRPGMFIGQLTFEEVDGLPIGKEGTYQDQNAPEGKV